MKCSLILNTLGKLSARWLGQKYSFRRKALKRLVEKSGFEANIAETMLDGLFSELSEAKLRLLLKSELGDARVLDGFQRDRLTGRKLRARGPERIGHIFSGNVPNPAVMSFVFGMLVKSANVGKVSSRDAGIIDIYLDSLREMDPQLAATNVLVDPADAKAVKSLLRDSELVVAYGNDESLAEIRKEVPARTPFFGYGHRMSFGVYAKSALGRPRLEKQASDTARDILITDRRGCLSPLVIFVEKGGVVSPEEFAEALAVCLEKTPSREAPDFWLAEQRRRVQKISGRVLVKGFQSWAEVRKALLPFKNNLQCASLAAGPREAEKISESLAALGVNRICAPGRMQFPPVMWHHDGMPNLAHWVKWTDWEQ